MVLGKEQPVPEDVKGMSLDEIISRTAAIIQQNKAQIFDIYEAARKEMESVKRSVERIKQDMAEMIFTVDDLENKDRQVRMRLMEVSRNFHVFNEEDIKKAYDEAARIKSELAVALLKEQDLRRQRDEAESRLKALNTMVAKAEALVSKVSVVIDYLQSHMGQVIDEVESLQQRQFFGVQVIKAQEEERLRVSREIHDEPAQIMANVIFKAELCERLMDTDVERARQELKALQDQVRQCLKETRKIIFNLRPMTLDDLGLAPTVRRLLDGVKERADIIPVFKIMGEEKRVSSPVEISLFRIIQEALKNAEKHGQATVINIIMEFRPKFVSAMIEDNGCGFDVSAKEENKDNIGLFAMRERAELLGGELSIKSEVGKGTKVYIRVPLIEEEAD